MWRCTEVRKRRRLVGGRLVQVVFLHDTVELCCACGDDAQVEIEVRTTLGFGGSGGVVKTRARDA